MSTSVDHGSTRIKLAKADGWTNFDWYEDNSGPAILTAEPPRDYPLRYGRLDKYVPDYENDLEQVRRLEFKLVGDVWYLWYIGLLRLECAQRSGTGVGGFVVAAGSISRHECASAQQRCRALVNLIDAGALAEPT